MSARKISNEHVGTHGSTGTPRGDRSRIRRVIAALAITVPAGLVPAVASSIAGATTAGASAITSQAQAPAGVTAWPEVIWGHDGYAANTCLKSDALGYTVFSPTSPGPHPIVFDIMGTGFQGAASCGGANPLPGYRMIDNEAAAWAAAGYVAVNVEYHGYNNGLFGDVTYPGQGKWGSVADGTVQLDIIPAISYFLSHNPGQYGGTAAPGIVVSGYSSGAHSAYMVGEVGIPGVKIAAVVGLSGLPDASQAGAYAHGVFDQYMRAQPGTDRENFGDADHRIHAGMPPVYVANGLNEFISPAGATAYVNDVTNAGGTAWLRLLNTSSHADAYLGYKFCGKAPEVSNPAATVGTTVQQDSIAFANTFA